MCMGVTVLGCRVSPGFEVAPAAELSCRLQVEEGGYKGRKNLSQPFTATWFHRAAKWQLMKEFLSTAEDQKSSGVNSQSPSGLESARILSPALQEGGTGVCSEQAAQPVARAHTCRASTGRACPAPTSGLRTGVAVGTG